MHPCPLLQFWSKMHFCIIKNYEKNGQHRVLIRILLPANAILRFEIISGFVYYLVGTADMISNLCSNFKRQNLI